jgi:hypothetical protein
MTRLPLIIGLLLIGMFLSGCASSRWWEEMNNPRMAASPRPDKFTAAKANATAADAQNPQSMAPNIQPNAQAMQAIMEELRQLGTLDPAAQNKLMDDLKQTDPALWPLVMQQFRAAIAYKRRAAEREMAAGNNVQLTGGNQPADQIDRLPTTQTPPQASNKVQPAVDQQPVKETSNPVVKASYEEPVSVQSDKWQEKLSGAISSLESSEKGNPKAPEELSRQARLRMLYVLAGRRDDALKPIPSAPPAMQEFWSKELYGLATLLDEEKSPDATRRAAESKQILHEALIRLGETAPLVVRNLTFCTAIQSYGCVTPFKKNEFIPDQEALLYAEMDNFSSESTSKGFHTTLRSSYQILDSAGQRVADHTFTTTEEYCQNPRRDFFIGYHLRMPKRINPGKYTLQLTIEDTKSQKVGQSSIEFRIKESEK